MAFKLVSRTKLRVPVKGAIADENGKPVNFNFLLHCARLTQTDIDAAVKNQDESVVDFVQRVVTGWDDVLDDSGVPIPFSADSMALVLDQAGMPVICYQSYLKEISITAKG